MTKRNLRKYGLLNFYQNDLFGELVSKDGIINIKNKNYNTEIYNYYDKSKFSSKKINKRLERPKKYNSSFRIFKKIKVNRRLLEIRNETALKKAYVKKFKRKEGFYYRVDIGKPKKKHRRISNFAERLLIRHKVRLFASQMSVKQFRSYLKIVPHFNKLFLMFNKFLESRFDFFVKRCNFVMSSRQGRQLINHCHFLINGNICNIQSLRLNPFDIVSIINKENYFFDIKKFNSKVFLNIPSYIEINFRILSAVLLYYPQSNEIPYSNKINMNFAVTTGKRFRG